MYRIGLAISNELERSSLTRCHLKTSTMQVRKFNMTIDAIPMLCPSLGEGLLTDLDGISECLADHSVLFFSC